MVREGINDLATTDPKILDEWDYDRNYQVKPSAISRYSLRVVWWKCCYGHRWRAKIADRVIDKEPCHICRKLFEKAFPDLLLRYYAGKSGYEVIADEEDLLGIPLANYLPEKNAVIEISKPEYNTNDGYRWEYAKTELCRRARIKLIRIIGIRDREFDDCVIITKLDNSDEALAEAIQSAFGIIRIEIETDVKADREYLFKKYISGDGNDKGKNIRK